MAVNRSVGAVTNYESFFGLREPPFGLAPNTRFRFESAAHQAALAQVTYALQRREPVAVVTGEIGTGKTLLCRTVVERLDRKTFLSIINDPLVGRDDLLKQMLQDFGIISTDRTKVAATSRPDLVHALDEFLLSLKRLDAHAVVVIDEAQHLHPEVLEEIRLLSNIQDDRGTLLQIILVGQADLESLLGKPELQSLKQRVSRYVRLEPMTAAEVEHYIEHRLAVAREGPMPSRTPGAMELERELAEWQRSPERGPFTPEAVARVAQLSRGIPRVVNLLCDRALESSFAANSRVADDRTIDAAARALDVPEAPRAAAPEPAAPEPAALEPPPPAEPPPGDLVTDYFVGQSQAEPSRRKRTVAAVASLAVLAFALSIWFRTRPPAQNRPSQSPVAAPTAVSGAAAAVRPSAPPTPRVAASASAAESRTPQGAAASPSGERFNIVIASFRTTARATAVAQDIAALGQPVYQRVANGWQQVLAGPFSSRAQAEAAQQRLEHAGYDDTQIVPAGQ